MRGCRHVSAAAVTYRVAGEQLTAWLRITQIPTVTAGSYGQDDANDGQSQCVLIAHQAQSHIA